MSKFICRILLSSVTLVIISILYLLTTTAALADDLDPCRSSANQVFDTESAANIRTANSWMASIKAKYPDSAYAYQQWLPCNGHFVYMWKTNASTTRPEDYAGTLGYESPLGTCHDQTTFSRPTVNCVLSPPNGPTPANCPAQTVPHSTPAVLFNDFSTVHDDGSVTGYVIYNNTPYIATLTDPACTTLCVAKFDRSCVSDRGYYQGMWYTDAEGNRRLTRWVGGNTNEPERMFGGQ